MNCQFLKPVNLAEDPKFDFEFSELECEVGDTFELITNPDYPEREFFVSKSLTYGEALIIFFLTLFLISAIAKFIFNFFWKR